jgi:hypothetical protein
MAGKQKRERERENEDEKNNKIILRDARKSRKHE